MNPTKILEACRMALGLVLDLLKNGGLAATLVVGGAVAAAGVRIVPAGLPPGQVLVHGGQLENAAWIIAAGWVLSVALPKLIELAVRAKREWRKADEGTVAGDLKDCLDAKAECAERIRRQNEELAAAYVTIGHKDGQIDHHLREKQALLANNETLISRLVALSSLVGARAVEPLVVKIDPASEPIEVKEVDGGSRP